MRLPLVAGFEDANPALALAAAFLGGIAASCTPCVYPMIPITIGFIGGQGSAGGRKRLAARVSLYVLGLAATYAALGAAASLSGSVFGQWSANPWVHLGVANLCLVFGLGSLDALDLRLPFRARPDPGPAGECLSALAMGSAAGLVAGPCTAPILGAVLVYVGLKQSLLFGMALLFAFALGMCLLLLACALSAGFLSRLPRSGPWLERVRKAFGWILILSAEYLLLRAGALF